MDNIAADVLVSETVADLTPEIPEVVESGVNMARKEGAKLIQSGAKQVARAGGKCAKDSIINSIESKKRKTDSSKMLLMKMSKRKTINRYATF